MWLHKLMSVFILVTITVKAESYYEGERTTWNDVTCTLGEPQLKYSKGYFEVNETLTITDDVWIGYLYAKVPFLLLGCSSLQSDNGVDVIGLGDCFTICRGGQFGIKRQTHESGLLCICVMGSFDTTETSCKGGDSLCNNCSEIYTYIHVNASNVGDPGNKPEGDCLTYYFPQFKWQPCSRMRNDPIRSMCSNATHTDPTATATIDESNLSEKWSAGNKLCLTHGRHPSFERSIKNTGFGDTQTQYYWTGIIRANIIIPLSLQDFFSPFSTDGYVYLTKSSAILSVAANNGDKKRALCDTGAENTSTHPETSKHTTEVTPSITPSTYYDTSVILTEVTTPDVATTDGSTSLPTTLVYTTLATDSTFPTSIDGIIEGSTHTNSKKSPALEIGIGVSVGILFLVGGAVVIVVLRRRGILHCDRKTVNNKPSANETAFKENMTYRKSMEDNKAHHNYFILEKCGQSISSNAEHYNESNEANMEDDYNTIHNKEEPYEHVKVENCDYDHTTNDLTPGSDDRKPENVYNKVKVDQPGDNGHGKRYEPSVVHISEDDYDTTSAIATNGKDDGSNYNHIPRAAYKAGANGDNTKGDKGGDYDVIDSMKFKVTQSSDSDYAHVNKDRIK